MPELSPLHVGAHEHPDVGAHVHLPTDLLPVDLVSDLVIVKFIGADDGEWTIEGYVATPELDLQGDIITPQGIRDGAATLNTSKRLLWNHHDYQIGVIHKAAVKDGGIWIKATLDKNARPPAQALRNEQGEVTDPKYPPVSRIWQWVKEGVVSRFSISGRGWVSAKTYVKNRVANLLARLNLDEASLVPLPANPGAELTSWYVQKQFQAAYKPTEASVAIPMDLVRSQDRRYVYGTAKVGAYTEEILDGMRRSPTVCQNTFDVPVGVVEEQAPLGADQIYVKIRLASTVTSPEELGQLVVRGSRLETGGKTIGYLPKGVWFITKELEMPCMSPEDKKALDDQIKQKMDELEALKAQLPADAPPVEPEKAEPPKEEAMPPKAVPPKPEPSNQAEPPALNAEDDEYPAPPGRKSQDPMTALKRAFKIIALALTKNVAGVDPVTYKGLQAMVKDLEGAFTALDDKTQQAFAKNLEQPTDPGANVLKGVSDLIAPLTNQIKELAPLAGQLKDLTSKVTELQAATFERKSEPGQVNKRAESDPKDDNAGLYDNFIQLGYRR